MCSKFSMTRFKSLWSRDSMIWQHIYISGSSLAQVMTCCLTAPSHYLKLCWHRWGSVAFTWWRQAISWTNIDSWGSVAFTWEHCQGKCWRIHSVTRMRILSHLPGANELRSRVYVFFWVSVVGIVMVTEAAGGYTSRHRPAEVAERVCLYNWATPSQLLLPDCAE